MPEISKDSATNIEEYGLSMDIGSALDDYTVDFVTIQQEH